MGFLRRIYIYFALYVIRKWKTEVFLYEILLSHREKCKVLCGDGLSLADKRLEVEKSKSIDSQVELTHETETTK